MASSVAALLLSLFAAVVLPPAAAYHSIAEAPYTEAPYPAPANYTSIAEAPANYASIAEAPANYVSIAEAPFSSLAPAAFEETAFTIEASSESYKVAAFDEQAMDSRYLTAHMSAAAHKVEVFVAEEVERKLNDPATAESDKACLAECKELYEGAAEAMKSGVESVSAGDFVKANFDVSAFNIDVATCSDDCASGGFDKFDRWAKAVAGDCLDKIVKYTNRV